MKILLLSNGYPSKELPFASIYVKNHFEKLSEIDGYTVDKHVIPRKYTSIFGSLIKFTKCFVLFAGKLFKKYDVIHVHFLSPIYLLAYLYKFLKSDSRIVLTLHGSDINKLDNPFLIKFYSFLLKKNDTVIAVSDELKRKAEQILSIKVDYVLSAGFNDDVFKYTGLTYQKRDIDFIFVGTFKPIKGLDTLINTIKILNRPDINFIFIGVGPLKSEIERLVGTYNVKIIDGLPQNQLNQYYNRAKFFILPSRNEGFNIALLEANYCGTPAIVRDIPALRKQVSDGDNGYLFSDEVQLIDIISQCHQLSGSEWEILSNNSMEKSKQYSLSNVINRMKYIYES